MRKLLRLFGRRDVVVAFGHDMREFALLWVVFANLDMFIQNHLTFLWMLGNLVFTGALWITGAYIENWPTRRNGDGT
jgi:hypothetical protein